MILITSLPVFGFTEFICMFLREITHLHMCPVYLLNVKVVKVQVQLLLAEFTCGDGLQVCA